MMKSETRHHHHNLKHIPMVMVISTRQLLIGVIGGVDVGAFVAFAGLLCGCAEAISCGGCTGNRYSYTYALLCCGSFTRRLRVIKSQDDVTSGEKNVDSLPTTDKFILARSCL
jgi:hypothetical protein